ncbi:MAG: putative cytochrome c [Proteobacteria bacterium]|nr:putative cytochrome c [Pseudomonadota bacterium]
MVRITFFFIFLAISVFARTGVYQKNCIPCHEDMAVKIDKFFYRYLLKYSSEMEVKNAMSKYLKNPKAENSILVDGLINRFGVKKKTTLSDEQLQEALDTYWEQYKVFDKLK